MNSVAHHPEACSHKGSTRVTIKAALVSRRQHRVSSGWLAFATVVLASIGVAARAIVDLAGVVLASDEYSHLVLIVPLATALIYRERKSVFATVAPKIGTSVTVLAVWGAAVGMLRAFGGELPADQRLSASIFALVTFWIAAFCICFGTAAAKRALFPLAFLLLLVPVPDRVMSIAVSFLQHTSADTANWLFGIAGVPVLRQGQVFVFVNQQIEISKECSGIRSAISLLITGLLLGHLSLRSKWSKIALATAVLPLAIFKNGLRIFTLSVLAAYVDPSFLSGALHRDGGILFFALVLFALILVSRFLIRLEAPTRSLTHGSAGSRAQKFAA